MPKRSISTEIQSAALFAALDFVGKPQLDRDWLKSEFVDPQINAVRVTADIVDAVEEKLRERLTEFAKTLQEELAELLKSEDEVDEESDLLGGDIPVVDYIGDSHSERKTLLESKLARANDAAKATSEKESDSTVIKAFGGITAANEICLKIQEEIDSTPVFDKRDSGKQLGLDVALKIASGVAQENLDRIPEDAV